MGGYTRRGSTD